MVCFYTRARAHTHTHIYLILALFFPKWKMVVKADLTQQRDAVSGLWGKEGRGCNAGGLIVAGLQCNESSVFLCNKP